jgi:hypothetical protein
MHFTRETEFYNFGPHQEQMFLDDYLSLKDIPYDREYHLAFVCSENELDWEELSFPFSCNQKIGLFEQTAQEVRMKSHNLPVEGPSDSLSLIQENSFDNDQDEEMKNGQELNAIQSISNPETTKPEKRWKQAQDVVLVKLLKSLVQSISMEFNELKKGRGKISKQLKWLLETAKSQSGWKGTIYELRTRISTRLNKSKFTVREERKAKKLCKQFFDGVITKEEVLESFPWKTECQIFAYSN